MPDPVVKTTSSEDIPARYRAAGWQPDGGAKTGHTPLGDLSEVLAVEPMDGGLRVTVTGEPGEVVARLAGAGVRRLHSHTPSLEQIFLTYYDTRASQREAVASAHGRFEPEPPGTAGGGPT